MRHLILAVTVFTAIQAHSEEPQRSQPPRARQIEQLLKVEEPRVLCIDDKLAGSVSPTQNAYAHAAASGFRSVLTLRNANDRVDLLRERFMVEENRLRYFNIPATSKLPGLQQVDEFLRLTRDRSNHPMLINCAFADRVAPFMMIFRIVEQGWGEDRAIDEAVQSGSNRIQLKKFAQDYLKRDKFPPNQKGR